MEESVKYTRILVDNESIERARENIRKYVLLKEMIRIIKRK